MTINDETRATRQEWALLCSPYLSQFVAMSFFYMAMTPILRSRGVPLAQISWIYLLGVVPALKFIWPPILDRYGFGQRGHYDMWLVTLGAASIVLAISLRLCASVPWLWRSANARGAQTASAPDETPDTTPCDAQRSPL